MSRTFAGSLLVRSLAVLVGVALFVSAPAQRDIETSELEALLKVKIRTVQHMALNPLVIRAVREQNALKLDDEEIQRRDEQWRASKELTPFKISLQGNRAGRFLRETVQRLDSVNEAFLTDAKGANVAVYPVTSDYWQGDEEKWTASFNNGKGKVFIGPVELDESTQAYAAQISAPVIDRGRTIGVLVVGVTIDYLEQRGK